MTESAFTCVDRVLPLELTTLADDLAVQERRDNEGGNLEAVGECHRFWAPGRTLRVRFLDSPELAPRVMGLAAAWTRHANLHLQVVAAGPADIRVTFAGAVSWSAVGTEALVTEHFPADRPTMCLQEIVCAESSERVKQIVRHEFGHAVGLVHEHANPAVEIDWDEAAVYAELCGPPHHWTKEMVHSNVFRRYSEMTTNHTDFDPESIMLYAMPSRWTRDGRTFPDNTALSPTDASFVAGIYPGRP